MSTTLAVALVIPWVFWGVLAGLLVIAGRSWINVLLIPVGITVLILLIASVSSVWDALWISLILHLFLLVYFLGSYISFVLRERKKRDFSR
jgi:hypothetical protein